MVGVSMPKDLSLAYFLAAEILAWGPGLWMPLVKSKLKIPHRPREAQGSSGVPRVLVEKVLLVTNWKFWCFEVAVQSLSHSQLLATPWTVAHQAHNVLHCLPECAQIPVHWVDVLSNPLILEIQMYSYLLLGDPCWKNRYRNLL